MSIRDTPRDKNMHELAIAGRSVLRLSFHGYAQIHPITIYHNPMRSGKSLENKILAAPFNPEINCHWLFLIMTDPIVQHQRIVRKVDNYYLI